jgi:hypothetical protein
VGQRIVLRASTVIGDVAIFDTDRTISGQDGESFASPAAAQDGISFSARLAERIFELDDAVTAVFVQSNAVTVRRSGGWSSTDEVGSAIEGFFEYYPG